MHTWSRSSDKTVSSLILWVSFFDLGRCVRRFYQQRYINHSSPFFCEATGQFWFTRLDKAQSTEIRVFGSLAKIDPEDFQTEIFICGGAQIYEQALPRCSDLYLTLVKRVVEGDAFFPPFEDRFKKVEEIVDCAEFKIVHYRNRGIDA